MTKKKWLLLDALLLIFFVWLDQFTKHLAVLHLKDQMPVSLIDGVLTLNYLENRGAAFGMLQGQKIFFVLIAVLFLAVVLYVLYRVPDEKKYGRLHFLMIMIAAGALGNLIDRLWQNYVVDFIYFVLIDFPIFNVADMYVTIATVCLAILVLFVYGEKDLEFLSPKRNQNREQR